MSSDLGDLFIFSLQDFGVPVLPIGADWQVIEFGFNSLQDKEIGVSAKISSDDMRVQVSAAIQDVDSAIQDISRRRQRIL